MKKRYTLDSSTSQRKSVGETRPSLLNITHVIQQLTRLLEPSPRPSHILVHAKIIRGNFTRGKLEGRGDIFDLKVVIETRKAESVSNLHQIPGAKVTRQHGAAGDGQEQNGARKRTQGLPSSAWGHPLTYPPEISFSSYSMQGEVRHRP